MGEVKLWRISQDANDNWDTYDSAVVAAVSAAQAKAIHPSGYKWSEDSWRYDDGRKAEGTWKSWALPAEVTAILVGVADESIEAGEVVCSSFNAG